MVAQLPQDFVGLEGREDGLDEHRRADRAARDSEAVLGEGEHVVPEARLEMALVLGEVEVWSRPLRDERGRVVEERQPEVEQGRRDWRAVYAQVLLHEMPSARPHYERRGAGVEGVAFPLGTRERDRPRHRVAEVLLAAHVALPRGRVR